MYRALYGTLMGICTRYQRDRQEAMALLNQGFLKILLGLEKRRPEVPFEAWVRRIMINTVIDSFRAERERLATERTDVLPERAHAAIANNYLEQMEAEDFAQLLEQVPAMSRHVFNLFAVDGYPHAEIATLLGISEGTSKWHVANARSILQKALAMRAMHHERPLVP